MKLEPFNTFCASLPSTTKVVQWGGAHVWKVGGKIFALCGPWGNAGKGFRIAFKCSSLSFQMLTEQKGIVPSPYLGRYKWVQVHDEDALSDEDMKLYIEAAHQMIAARLTKKVRAELGL